MESTSKHPHGSGREDDASSPRKPVATPTDTQQSRMDKQEKQKHPASENEVESAQDKNPIPPDSTRK